MSGKGSGKSVSNNGTNSQVRNRLKISSTINFAFTRAIVTPATPMVATPTRTPVAPATTGPVRELGFTTVDPTVPSHLVGSPTPLAITTTRGPATPTPRSNAGRGEKRSIFLG